MQSKQDIVEQVYAAKNDMVKADDLIQAYIPFIRSETAKYLGVPCTGKEDEFSIAMIAFHEAIQSYKKERGAFFNYTSMLIRSRLIDYTRKEAKHRGGISLDAESDEDNLPIHERISDNKNELDDKFRLEATKEEIEELAKVMQSFGVNFTDVSEHSPKQERTLETCMRAVNYAIEHNEILDELLETKKLPISELAKGANVEKKTLERHRKYMVAMLLIQTNGYEIIRGHLRHIVKKKGGLPA